MFPSVHWWRERDKERKREREREKEREREIPKQQVTSLKVPCYSGNQESPSVNSVKVVATVKFKTKAWLRHKSDAVKSN